MRALEAAQRAGRQREAALTCLLAALAVAALPRLGGGLPARALRCDNSVDLTLLKAACMQIDWPHLSLKQDGNAGVESSKGIFHHVHTGRCDTAMPVPMLMQWVSMHAQDCGRCACNFEWPGSAGQLYHGILAVGRGIPAPSGNAATAGRRPCPPIAAVDHLIALCVGRLCYLWPAS